MKWTQVRVRCKAEETDQVGAVMSMINSGLMIEDYSDIEENLMTVYGELIDEKILNSDRSVAAVSIYLSEEEDVPACVAFIEKQLSGEGILAAVEQMQLDEEDWANQWKQFYKPLHIGKHLLVLPPWEECEILPEDVVIVMDPGMAFGTGTHETTRLCLTMLEKHLEKGEKMLDVGTGSGILTIAGIKLGAVSSHAYDIDPVAVKVAKENMKANGVDGQSFCGVSDLLKGVDREAGPFSFVTANIVADILIRMAPDIGGYMAEGGRLVASGIIEGRREDVLSAMQAGGLTLIDEDSEQDWCVLVFRKN